MTADEVAEFLTHGGTIMLALHGPDGYPDLVPMWFLFEDGAIWMRTYGKSQKVVNARRDPRCSVLVEQGDHYAELRGVQITGDLELVDDVDRICEIAAGLTIKYEGVDPVHRDALMTAYLPRAPKQVAMRLPIDRLVSWDHRKLTSA